MTRAQTTLGTLAATALCAFSATADPAEPAIERPEIGVEILAPDAVAPGATVDIGVRYAIQADWHIYWKNPGDAGLPTTVEVEGPDGTVAGEIRWPLPSRFVSADGTVGYGYADEATLWRPVTVPDHLSPGEVFELTLSTDWLACKLLCVPGSAKKSVEIPVAAETRSADSELIDRYPSAADLPFEVKTSSGAGGARRVTLKWPGGTAPQVEWFPAPPETHWVENVRTRSTNDRTMISYTLRSSGPADAGTEMETIVVVTDADGSRRGFTVMVPIT